MRFHHNNKSRQVMPMKIKQTLLRKKSIKGKRVRLAVLSLAIILAMASVTAVLGAGHSAQARDFNAEIRALQNQINDYRKHSSELAAKSGSLQVKISQLENDQAQIQAQIDLLSAKRAQLEQQIAQAEAKIKRQAQSLSKNLRDQYYSSKTTSLDILMNSRSVSDYVDRQTRQKTVSDNISKSVKEIKATKADLQKKKSAVEDLISKQDQQKQQLIASKNEQKKILDETQGQEEKFRELTAKTEAQKAKVQAEQQAAIRRFSGAGTVVANSKCGGGYPFCNYPADVTAYAGGFQALGNTRECVNYVQWRIFQLTGRNELHGNAGSWMSVANSGAQVNTVAIIGYGRLPYGHVAWVEEVRGGSVLISEYNWNPYNYTERWVSASSFDGFYNPL
ncbi:CHAP domain-containing protein [Candidatus Nanoperiomorbus periodonticus]|uniref:CHAP domain-containing protein n=1 Tax=Candidatus Nanoperiomorbus periodonticus TaxID=2171989 RepID=UPI00101D810C|nr:CHAP domain-containing protein [Candidatus Nanoperiomorbus periodonticus]RYC76228.1 Chromosome partition protein Smc [Candidatus Nanoperiomorbus periodonticus]